MPIKSPSRIALLRSTAILALLSLSYVAGSAAMYLHLPTAGFLEKAFRGAEAWRESEHGSSLDQAALVPTVVQGQAPDKAFDGYTLEMVAGMNARSNSEAVLVDMKGNVLHKWKASFHQIWPDPHHLRGRLGVSDTCFFDGHLYANGDLLVVFHGSAGILQGYGLVKLDRDSNVLWKYSAAVHHDVDVGEGGVIYCIKQETISELPSGLEHIGPPVVTDYLVMLSPDGQELRSIPILEAFRDSPYSVQLSAIEGWLPGDVTTEISGSNAADILHTNSVNVLSRELAPSFPMFKAGQVLISLREISTLAVLDPESGVVVWATRGPWRAQHDAQFLDNGHLLIFDNLGAVKGARVLEFDPQTQAFPWAYMGNFHCPTRGMAQRLPNGNTLIVDSEGGKILEVTPDKDLAWSCSCHGFVHVGRRYGRDQLPFLKTSEHARP